VLTACTIVGASNAVNLTDGLDGLAIGCTVIVSFVFLVLTDLAGNARTAAYLQIPHVPGAGELTVFCAAMLGAGLGFLWFNCHPARVFMGTPVRWRWAAAGHDCGADPSAAGSGHCRRGFCGRSRLSHRSEDLVQVHQTSVMGRAGASS